MLKRVTQRTLVTSRTRPHRFVWWNTPFASQPLYTAFRHCSTSTSTTTGSANVNGTANLSEAEKLLLQRCKFNSDILEERLGFVAGHSFTEEELKKNFQFLAKHFHPDTATGANNTEAFSNIKEAYDHILKMKRAGYGGGSQGFQFHDEARRRAHMKALGEGVVFFLAVTIAFLLIAWLGSSRRNGSFHVSALLGLTFLVQFFPRLLSITILFAFYTVNVAEKQALTEQAQAALVLERTPKDVRLRIEGIDEVTQPHVVVEVKITTPTPLSTKPTETSASTSTTTTTSLVMDPGVLDCVVPAPPRGCIPGQTTYVVTATDQERASTLFTKTLHL